jgi:pyridoxal phosphate enzyme (YggS family)
VKLVAVSKTKSNDQIMEAYQAGQRLFGENKVQELMGKWKDLPKDIQWHFIGHLQRNKVKQIVPLVSLIHGVDSFKLLSAINQEAARNNLVIAVLLEFHIAAEDSKFGLTYEKAEEILSNPETKAMKNILIKGVMGMATFTSDEKIIQQEFDQLSAIFARLKQLFFAGDDQFCELSMGMSDDFLLAVQAGSTMVRIGSSIFGSR